MTSRILPISHDSRIFVTRSDAYTAWELWLAGLATFGGGW